MSANPNRSAFTMIEILIVIAIIGVITTISLPAIRQAASRDSMRRVTADIMEACQRARARAILTGVPSELIFEPETRKLVVAGSSGPAPENENNQIVKSAPPEAFEVEISDRMIIETWSVNFLEMKDEQRSAIRFYPNGTSDEFMLIFRSELDEWRQIKLDVITGTPDLKVIR